MDEREGTEGEVGLVAGAEIGVEYSGRNWSAKSGDCLTVMQSMPDNSWDMIFTSPPYEDARLYGELNFKVRGQDWVDWCIPRIIEMCRITNGLVFFNAVGKRRNWKYSPCMEWLVADLTRIHGLVCGPAPYVFHRIGVPGSGSKKYHRRDWEPIYAFAMPKKVPPKWTDNTALGHPPKWAPGGEMSNRKADGERVNGKRPSHIMIGGRDQWGGTGHASGGEGRKKSGEFKTPHTYAEKVEAGAKIHTKRDADEMRSQAYLPPVIADPGNVIHCSVGGGRMGHKLAHENEAPFPLKLAEFFVLSYCPPGGKAGDPFCGSGTVLHAAAIHGRVGCGIDMRPDQIEVTRKRMASLQQSLFNETAA